jgi:hypothetical protein
MAKKKSEKAGKAETARKGKPAKKRTAAEPDRCQPLRDQLAKLNKEIAGVQASLADPDIPRDLRKRLEQLLRQLLAMKKRVLRDLEACERIPDDPRR